MLFIEGGPSSRCPLEQERTCERAVETSETVGSSRRSCSRHRLNCERHAEEFGGCDEELRAANEELQSINEEYRSTSEELETSKEELQSINEELQTVNNELKLKLETVSRAHSDLQNLMAATDFGTLFLDTALRIKRFTPCSPIFQYHAGRCGRPITDFTHQLDYDGLADELGRCWRISRPSSGDPQPQRRLVPGAHASLPHRRRQDRRCRRDVRGHHRTARGRGSATTKRRALRQQTRLVEISREPIFVWDFDAGITNGIGEANSFTAMGARK